jgi:hypothetical protein
VERILESLGLGENPICRLSYIEIEVGGENPREFGID